MKYRLTPGNGFCLFLAGVLLYLKFESVGIPEKLAASYLLYFLVTVLIADLLLQILITHYRKLVLTKIIALPVAIAVTLAA